MTCFSCIMAFMTSGVSLRKCKLSFWHPYIRPIARPSDANAVRFHVPCTAESQTGDPGDDQRGRSPHSPVALSEPPLLESSVEKVQVRSADRSERLLCRVRESWDLLSIASDSFAVCSLRFLSELIKFGLQWFLFRFKLGVFLSEAVLLIVI